MSERLAQDLGVARERRQQPARIVDYAGNETAGGSFYSGPTSFSLGGLQDFTESMEITPLAPILGYEVIIPYWWQQQSGYYLDNKGKLRKRISSADANPRVRELTPEAQTESPKRQDPKGTTRDFLLEWDESVLVQSAERIFLSSYVLRRVADYLRIDPDGS
ncbi:MAG TPA: hypothetical protein VM715_02405 [Candidatus Acidoferrum sp.]|nr:hypothetical protein [Candidatus Acidoferrum sp.]